MKSLFLVCALSFVPGAAFASDAKDDLLVRLHTVKQHIENGDWNFNNQKERDRQEEEAEILHKAFNMVARYEATLALTGCQRSAIVTSRGRPVSLSGRPVNAVNVLRVVEPPVARSTEVRLIERIVRGKHELEERRWYIADRDKKKRLERAVESDQEALGILHQSRCPLFVGRAPW